ncbi:MAG: hypothetical protein RBG1_1C00001G0425 [candidate division Zixibacteria bacterium RBG-1]|nr:MAG: hypothetical protein RBG1_1C00001G0425 [candidate division Zixibacteria bacterium RBG-1]OGC84767.1 MAG: signal peptidase I [candidate division Zixibacteria bacterium RBG_19FT_COMBO_42_43]
MASTKPEPQIQKVRRKSVLRDYAESLIVALILALIIKTSLVEAYKIPSGSMEDTLLVGDFLLANKFIYGSKIPLIDVRLPAIREPKPGDVIIFKFPGNLKQNYIKRLIATEGQVVEIKNKQVYVDGKPLADPPHVKHTDNTNSPIGNPNRDNFGPYRVPKGFLFAMGDNRDNSYDSRFWGPLDRKLVLGKAMILHWSWKKDDHAPEMTLSNPLSIPHSIAYNIWHFPDRVRWNRIGSIIK